MCNHSNPFSPAAQWRAAYSAARSGRIFLEQPFAHQALIVLAHEHGREAVRHDRWLQRSIPDLASASRSHLSPVDVARWLVSARAALYALWSLRRQQQVVS